MLLVLNKIKSHLLQIRFCFLSFHFPSCSLLLSFSSSTPPLSFSHYFLSPFLAVFTSLTSMHLSHSWCNIFIFISRSETLIDLRFSQDLPHILLSIRFSKTAFSAITITLYKKTSSALMLFILEGPTIISTPATTRYPFTPGWREASLD